MNHSCSSARSELGVSFILHSSSTPQGISVSPKALGLRWWWWAVVGVIPQKIQMRSLERGRMDIYAKCQMSTMAITWEKNNPPAKSPDLELQFPWMKSQFLHLQVVWPGLGHFTYQSESQSFLLLSGSSGPAWWAWPSVRARCKSARRRKCVSLQLGVAWNLKSLIQQINFYIFN